MSGIVGSITKMSYKFNDLAMNDKIKGIKLANHLEEEIIEAETTKDEKTTDKEEIINAEVLAQEIKEDMER